MPNKGRSKKKCKRSTAKTGQAGPSDAAAPGSSTTAPLSSCIDFENQRLFCVICGLSSTRGYPQMRNHPDPVFAWLDRWTACTLTRRSSHPSHTEFDVDSVKGVGRISRDPAQWNVIHFPQRPAITITGSYEPDANGVIARPVHCQCEELIHSKYHDDLASGRWDPIAMLECSWFWPSIFDLVTEGLTKEPPVGRYRDYSKAPIRCSTWSLYSPETDYMAAQPVRQPADDIVNSQFGLLILSDPCIARSVSSEGEQSSRGLIVTGHTVGLLCLPDELLNDIAEFVLALSPRQPWACKGTAKERRERIAHYRQHQRREIGMTDYEKQHLKDPEADGEFDAMRCCGYCIGSKRIQDLSATREAIFSRLFVGERALLALRASHRSLYHFRFSQRIWYTLLTARIERYERKAIPCPPNNGMHYCEPDLKTEIGACIHGYESLTFSPACARKLVDLEACQDAPRAASKPILPCTHEEISRSGTSKSPGLVFAYSEERHHELLAALEHRKDYDVEGTFHAYAGLRNIRNLERLLRNYIAYRDSVIDAVFDKIPARR